MLKYRPRKNPKPTQTRLSAFRFTVRSTIRRGPHQGYFPTFYDLFQVCLENILCQVNGIRMVYLVHPDRFRIMVYGNIHRSSQCHFYSHACPSASGKTINNQIVHPFPHFRFSSSRSIPFLLPASSRRYIHIHSFRRSFPWLSSLYLIPCQAVCRRNPRSSQILSLILFMQISWPIFSE